MSRSDAAVQGSSWQWYVGFALLLALAGWVRLSNVSSVFVQGEVVPLGGDSAYHVRRTLLAAEAFPTPPVADPLINWPDGGASHWAPGMDQLGAVMIKLLGVDADEDRSRQQVIVVLLPVIFGLLLVWAVVELTRSLLGRTRRAQWTALSAGLVAALLPQSIAISQLGRVDHHVLEGLSMACLGIWTLRGMVRRRGAQGAVRQRLLHEVTGSLLITAALYLFNGSVLYVAIAAALLLGEILLRRPDQTPVPHEQGGDPTEVAGALVGSGALALLFGGLLTALCYLPAILIHGRWVNFVFPSLLQPILVLVAGLCLTGAWAARRFVLRRAGLSARQVRVRSAGLWFGGVIVVLILGAVLAPGVAEEVRSGLVGWLAREDPWLATIEEFAPLFSGQPPWSTGGRERLVMYYGYLGIAAPVLLVAGLAAVYKRDRQLGSAWIAWTVALTLLTLLQSRFSRILLVNIAVCSGIAIDWLSLALQRRLSAGQGDRPHTSVVFGVMLPLFVAGGLCLLDPRMGAVLLPESGLQRLSPTARSAVFLRHQAASGLARSGVLAPWDEGHLVQYFSGYPVVTNGFGPYLDPRGYAGVQAAYRGSLQQMTAFMRERRLGWALGGPQIAAKRGIAPEGLTPLSRGRDGRVRGDPDFLRVRPTAVLISAGSGVPGRGVPHAPQLCPRWASRETVTQAAVVMPLLWIYQRVEGAHLAGRARPGQRVVARLQLFVHELPLPYLAWTDARADGTYRLTVPIPSGFSASGVRSGGAWHVRAAPGRVVAVQVRSEQVARGAVVQVPDTPLPSE